MKRPQKRPHDRDLLRALQQLTRAAEAFVNRAPKVQRAERAALLDAITDAQRVRSVHRLPTDNDEQLAVTQSKRLSMLEEQIQTTRATLSELERRLRPLTGELDGLQSKAQRAKWLMSSALSMPEVHIETNKAA